MSRFEPRWREGVGLCLLEDRRLLSAFTVTTSADSGPGSLRQAILDANANPGRDEIRFQLAGSRVIELRSSLPTISDAVAVNGRSQPGYSGSPLVTITGRSIVGGADGLTIAAPNVEVSGLVISGFAGAGLRLSGPQATGAWIRSNWIGVAADGETRAANRVGLLLENGASSNRIGTNADNLNDRDERNVISGNLENGLVVQGPGTSNNQIAGNFIGTNASGAILVGNGGNGVLVRDRAENNLIGGSTSLAGNRIAGNSGDGVRVVEGARRIAIRNNPIFFNAGLGIDLNGDGPTPNDPGDNDSGPNDLVNRPTLVAPNQQGDLIATINARPSTAYVIEFFLNPNSMAPPGSEGELVLGSTTVVTDASGFASFATRLLATLGPNANVVATATDPQGNTSEFSPSIQRSVPPRLVPIPSQTIDEGQTLRLSALLSTPILPGDSVIFLLGPGAPAGATITPNGQFSWTPTEAQGPGVYRIAITATNAIGQSDSVSFDVNVREVNQSPQLDPIPNRLAVEEALIQFRATASDPDIPAQRLSFFLGAGAPIGAAITSDGLFTWTPTEEQGPRDHSITIIVSDGAAQSSQTFVVSVAESNRPPTLGSLVDRVINEQTPLNFQATAFDPDVPIQTLTYRLGSGAPAGASITPDGRFSWTPTEAQGPGSYPITIEVFDGLLADSRSFLVRVDEVNQPPQLDPISDQSISELAELRFQAAAIDPDLPAQRLTFALGPGAPAGASISPNGLFTWTPTEEQGPATYPITVVVSDGLTTDSRRFLVAVGESNAPPRLAPIADQTINEQTLLRLQATASDPDIPTQRLTFALAPGAPAGASITPDGLFAWTPTEEQGPGEYSITITVSDGALSDSRRFTVRVLETNLPPRLAPIPDQSIREQTALRIQAAASDPDVPRQNLRFSLGSGAPAGASITPDGLFAWTPTEEQGPGAYTITIIVSDGQATDSQRFTVRVEESNAPPRLEPIADQNINEQTELRLQARAADPDIPVQRLLFSLGPGAPSGASITSDGLFTWTPTEAQGPGDYPVTITVSDGQATDSLTFTVRVAETNRPPRLNPIADRSIDELQELRITLEASDPDLPRQTLRYSLGTSAPTGMTITPDGVLTWTPSEAQGPGEYPITVTATDGQASDSVSFVIRVREVNRPPQLGAIEDQTVREFERLTLQIPVVDPDLPSQPLTFRLGAGAPEGARITPGGQFSWTPNFRQGGRSYPITVIVSDGLLETSGSFTVNVRNVNLPPTIREIPVITFNEDSGVIETISGLSTGPEGESPTPETLSLTAKIVGDGLLQEASVSYPGSGGEGRLILRPNPDAFGTTIVEVTARDSGDGDNQTTITIVVVIQPVNDAPSFAPIPVGAARLTEAEIASLSSSFPNDFAPFPTASITVMAGGQPAILSLNGVSAGPANEANQRLTLLSVSSDPQLVSVGSFQTVITAGLAERVLKLTPGSEKSGQAIIRIAVVDSGGIERGGDNQFVASILVTVLPGLPNLSSALPQTTPDADADSDSGSNSSNADLLAGLAIALADLRASGARLDARGQIARPSTTTSASFGGGTTAAQINAASAAAAQANRSLLSSSGSNLGEQLTRFLDQALLGGNLAQALQAFSDWEELAMQLIALGGGVQGAELKPFEESALSMIGSLSDEESRSQPYALTRDPIGEDLLGSLNDLTAASAAVPPSASPNPNAATTPSPAPDPALDPDSAALSAPSAAEFREAFERLRERVLQTPAANSEGFPPWWSDWSRRTDVSARDASIPGQIEAAVHDPTVSVSMSAACGFAMLAMAEWRERSTPTSSRSATDRDRNDASSSQPQCRDESKTKEKGAWSRFGGWLKRLGMEHPNPIP